MKRIALLGIAAAIAATILLADWRFWQRFATMKDQDALSMPHWTEPTEAVISADWPKAPQRAA